MNKDERKKMTAKDWILLIAFTVLIVTGLVFLGLSLFSGEPGSRNLAAGLGCITAANLINLYNIRRRNREKNGGKAAE